MDSFISKVCDEVEKLCSDGSIMNCVLGSTSHGLLRLHGLMNSSEWNTEPELWIDVNN